jgi:hypothetical protein
VAVRRKICSTITTILPNADKDLVETLAIKVEQETRREKGKKFLKTPNRNALIQRIIIREELIELGLKTQ